MTTVDLNADLGESFGAYTIGQDKDMLQIVSSANIACGFHGGDPAVMDATIKEAKRAGVRMGSHPGFNDLAGFGRRKITGNTPEEIGQMIIYQIGAFQGMAKANDAQMDYVKLHGALSNMAMVDAALAAGFVDAICKLDTTIDIMALPNSEVEKKCKSAGIKVIREVFADRAYLPNGMLVPRGQKGAVILDAVEAAQNVLRMVEDQCITAIDGTKIATSVDSICIHGDNPAAVRIAEKLRTDLERAGVSIAPISGS